MPTGVIELLILAGIAVFLLMRLRGVLGARTGLEEQQAPRAPRAEPTRAQPAPAPAPLEEGVIDPDSATVAEGDDAIGSALSDMRRAEPGFLPSEFLSGARQAFEMILMAFENGDLDTLRRFLAPDVYEGFAGAIEARLDRVALLAPLASMVVGVFEAHPRHGGAGALYVYLKKRR